jgi:small neutral amino acid transporter SnatA (MarC family)
MLEQFLNSSTLLFVILNPFMLSIYLWDLIQDLDSSVFRRVLVRGAMISVVVFVGFAVTGDAVFQDVLQVRFASFLIFGGVVFAIIGLQFVFKGPESLRGMRGPPEHIAGSIAMPFMIGPGSVSASVLAGAQLPAGYAVLAVLCAVALTVACLIGMKAFYVHAASQYTTLTTRYVDIVGRISALVIGTIAVDMILNGLEIWLKNLSSSG